MGLTKIAISRPVTMLMLMIAVILLGITSYSSMPKELNPDVSFGIVSVFTTYPGATPDEVNNLVSKKIEDGISGVNGIREITSTSLEGQSIVTVSFNLNIDLNNALNDVRSKVDTVLGSLPTEVQKPTIQKIDVTGSPVIYYAFSSSKLTSSQLRDLMDNQIEAQFGQVDGVGQVSVQGGDVREIQVQLSKSKLLAYGIGINAVQQALASSTVNQPSGHLVTGQEQYNVRVLGEFQSVDQIKNSVISITDPNSNGGNPATVRLSDIATVTDTVQERTTYSQLNGKDTIVLAITKSNDGNTVDVVNGCNAVLAQVLKSYSADGLKVITTQDQGKQVKDSLNDLLFTLCLGIFLVSAVVFVFLHNFRGTLIVATAIPICMFGTFIALKLAGFTINNLTMLALSLATGVLVDDAIVVLENIYRHLQLGEDPKEAAINGRGEIGLAAIAITMADVVVFLPIAFLGDILGQFMRPLALGYVFATLCSLLVSFTITPMLASRWYRRGEDMEHPTGRFASWFERSFKRLERNYGTALEWSLNHRWFVFITGNLALMSVIFLIVGSTAKSPVAALMSPLSLLFVFEFVALLAFVVNLIGYKRFKPKFFLNAIGFFLIFPVVALIGFGFGKYKGEPIFKFSFFPQSDTGALGINIELPPGTPLAKTAAVTDFVVSKVLQDKDVKYALSSLGQQGFATFSTGNQGPNYGGVTVALYDKASASDDLEFWVKQKEYLRRKTIQEVSADIQNMIGKVAGAKITVAAAAQFGGGSDIQLSFRSNDIKELTNTVNTVSSALKAGKIPGVINVELSSKPGQPELQIIPDRQRLADAGISVSQLASAFSVLYQGDDNVKYRENGEEYTVRTMMSFADRNNPNTINEVPITFKNGNPIFVPSVGTIVKGAQLDKETRRDRLNEIQVTASVLPGYSVGNVQNQINNMLTAQKMVPANVQYQPLGQADSQQRNMGGIIAALFTGLLFVYMLLAALYENLLYPLIIQVAQPQAFVGALLCLMIFNQEFNLIGFIGIITLIGLVGKNAILLVDYTNTLKARGRNRHDALVEAGPTRLRPIMMTSVALFCSMLPVAIAFGRGSEFRQTLGFVLIGGVTLSTILTLVVIPCSYTIFDDFSQLIGKGLGFFQAGARSRRQATSNPLPEPTGEEADPSAQRL